MNIQEKGDLLIRGIGIDIIELKRIERSLQKNSRIVERILTKEEREVFDQLKSRRRKIEYLAGRFTAKEAFAKAVGTGIGSLSFQHIQVLTNEKGAPYIQAKGYDASKIFISITHSQTYAVANVVISI